VAGTNEREVAMNIFDCAIKMEEEAAMTYQKLAENTTVAELKNLFTLLAESEQEHYDAFVKIKESVGPLKAKFKDLREAACLFKPLLAKRDLSAELLGQPDAYLHIVKEEEKGVQFYEDLAGQAKNAETRKILAMIANEERKHLNIVKNIYSFVESPKNFLAWGEFSNLNEL
jgi:rubrerythrin